MTLSRVRKWTVLMLIFLCGCAASAKPTKQEMVKESSQTWGNIGEILGELGAELLKYEPGKGAWIGRLIGKLSGAIHGSLADPEKFYENQMTYLKISTMSVRMINGLTGWHNRRLHEKIGELRQEAEELEDTYERERQERDRLLREGQRIRAEWEHSRQLYHQLSDELLDLREFFEEKQIIAVNTLNSLDAEINKFQRNVKKLEKIIDELKQLNELIRQ